MNTNSKAGKKPFYIIFTAITVFVLFVLCLKPVSRIFYPVKYADIIKKYSLAYNLDEHMIMAVINTESKFDKNAVSHKNAKGLMQLKDETAVWCMEKFDIDPGKEDIFSPELNIRIGCAYLSYLTDKFGNADIALAAYNAGEGIVTKWLEDNRMTTIPYEETDKYVKNVNRLTKIYRFLY